MASASSATGTMILGRIPAHEPPTGTAMEPAAAPMLFRPLQVRDVRLANQVAVSPMCQYSAWDGKATDWHLVHPGQFALADAGLTFFEATAVEARGRISPEDLGIWADSQVAPLRRIVDFVHAQGHKVGIQLAHAGRKTSTLVPWRIKSEGRVMATADDGGWPDDVVAPSARPYDGAHAVPRELSEAEIEGLVAAFAAGARRSVDAGFDVIEIYAAHGYLLSGTQSGHEDEKQNASFALVLPSSDADALRVMHFEAKISRGLWGLNGPVAP